MASFFGGWANRVTIQHPRTYNTLRYLSRLEAQVSVLVNRAINKMHSAIDSFLDSTDNKVLEIGSVINSSEISRPKETSIENLSKIGKLFMAGEKSGSSGLSDISRGGEQTNIEISNAVNGLSPVDTNTSKDLVPGFQQDGKEEKIPVVDESCTTPASPQPPPQSASEIFSIKQIPGVAAATIPSAPIPDIALSATPNANTLPGIAVPLNLASAPPRPADNKALGAPPMVRSVKPSANPLDSLPPISEAQRPNQASPLSSTEYTERTNSNYVRPQTESAPLDQNTIHTLRRYTDPLSEETEHQFKIPQKKSLIKTVLKFGGKWFIYKPIQFITHPISLTLGGVGFGCLHGNWITTEFAQDMLLSNQIESAATFGLIGLSFGIARWSLTRWWTNRKN